MIKTIILAIDPALTTTGYSIFQIKNKTYIQLEYGRFKLDNNLNYFDRIITVKVQLDKLLSKYKITDVVIEDIHYQARSGIKVYKKLAQMQFYLLYYFFNLQICTSLVQVNSWRHLVCKFYGLENAKKKYMVQIYL